MKILFICHKSEIYGQHLYTRRSSGLFNSTSFIVRSLRHHSIDAHIVEVGDNNEIDREVTKHRPDLVVIEALWVVPEKFAVLKRLHPRVRWFVHLHSDMPFLALEGIALDWIIRCAREHIGIIANSLECFEALAPVVPPEQLHYLPNVYLGRPRRADLAQKHHAVNIACFGAVRPLKNHLLQALAAIQYARDLWRPLRFHINVGRVETGGAPVLKNLRQLFRDTSGTTLVEHHWFEPHDFLPYLQHNIDIGMQVSLTETFNVVTADYVTAGLPVVVSKEVKWVSPSCRAIDNSLPDIVEKMHYVAGGRMLVAWNQVLLAANAKAAGKAWHSFCSR